MTVFRYILMKGSVTTGAANLFGGKYFMFSSSTSLSLHSDETNWARSIGIVWDCKNRTKIHRDRQFLTLSILETLGFCILLFVLISPAKTEAKQARINPDKCGTVYFKKISCTKVGVDFYAHILPLLKKALRNHKSLEGRRSLGEERWIGATITVCCFVHTLFLRHLLLTTIESRTMCQRGISLLMSFVQ